MMPCMQTSTTLATYLADNGLSVAAFAASVGAHRSQIDRIAKGERGAGGVLALAIERETKGAVKASEVVKPRHVNRRRHTRRLARTGT
jgi:DNA-binding transcriptional regulator YdaS (Cro superfamily)